MNRLCKYLQIKPLVKKFASVFFQELTDNAISQKVC